MKLNKKAIWKVELLLRTPALIMALLLAIANSTHCQTTAWVEERTFVSEGKATPRISGLINHQMNKQWGTFVWFQMQPSYSQSYGGITHSPRPWVQLAIGPGIEQAKNPTRVGSYIWMGGSKQSILFIAEDGGSGFWYKSEAMRSIAHLIDVGIISERYKGTGPEIRLKIPRTHAFLWYATMIERQKTNALFGIRFTY